MERKAVARWLMPSLGDAIFISIFLRTLQLGGQLLNDSDTGWHIVTGRLSMRNLWPPDVDTFSHTMAGASWTSNEWLSDVIFAAVDGAMGLNGVVVFSAAVVCLTFFFLYRYMLYRKASPLTAAFFTLLAVSASVHHWLARPHIFSFGLTLAFIVVLETYQREGKNRLLLLPFLTVLWVNLHGGFMLGIALVALYAAGNLFAAASPESDGGEGRKRFMALLNILFLSCLAGLVNPHGPAAYQFPLKLMGQQYVIDSIMEWMSPDFHVSRAFELTLLVFACTFVLSRRRPDFFEGAVALSMTHMALNHTRFIPLMAVAVAPMVALRADEALGRLAGRLRGAAAWLASRVKAISDGVASRESAFNRHIWVYAAVTACMIAALNGGRLAGAQAFDYGFDPARFPVEAFGFARENGINGKMFNAFGWGGYIIFEGYPDYRVFIDGRFEPYETPLTREYTKVEEVRYRFEDILDKYGVDWVIYFRDAPLCRILAAQGGWSRVHADQTAEILLRRTPGNATLIGKYEITDGT